MNNPLESFHNLETLIGENLMSLYQVPSHSHSMALIGVERFDLLLNIWRLSSDLPFSVTDIRSVELPITQNIASGLGSVERYYRARTHLQRKLDFLKMWMQDKYDLRLNLYPLKCKEQLQEVHRILQHYYFDQDRDRDGLSESDRFNTLQTLFPDVTVLPRTRMVQIQKNWTVFPLLDYLFTLNSEDCRKFRKVIHFAACRVYFLLWKARVFDEMKRIIHWMEGNHLTIEDSQYIVYYDPPRPITGSVTISYVTPEDTSYQRWNNGDRVHLLSWIEYRLGHFYTFREFESIIGSLSVEVEMKNKND